MSWLPDDWSALFVLEIPLLELFVRGSALYFVLLVLMRFMPRRTGGELATMDLAFLLLLAEAASNAFGEYTSVAEGLILVVALMAGITSSTPPATTSVASKSWCPRARLKSCATANCSGATCGANSSPKRNS